MTGLTEALPGAARASLYDAVPYPGHPFQQTHPDRLATLPTLFGLQPPPLERCRVLELGCGDGGNLVPVALALPGARFLGIDAAAGAIARGRALPTRSSCPMSSWRRAPDRRVQAAAEQLRLRDCARALLVSRRPRPRLPARALPGSPIRAGGGLRELQRAAGRAAARGAARHAGVPRRRARATGERVERARPPVLEQMAVSSPARPRREPGSDAQTTFEGPSGSTLTTDHPLVSGGVERLGRSWPAALWVRELTPRNKRSGRGGAPRRAPALLCGQPGPAARTTAGARRLRRRAARGQPARPPPRPLRQARDEPPAHQRADRGRPGRRLVTLLDGRRDRATLTAELRAWPEHAGQELPPDLDDGLERSLQGLAGLALLRC